jgi:acid phosphatase
MTTLIPRAPYTQEELATLYPSDLELRQVQVILRHGERTPVNSRFKNVRVYSSLKRTRPD